MIDPLSITIAFLMLRRGIARNRQRAQREYSEFAEEYKRVQENLRRETGYLLKTMDDLGNHRLGYVRRLMERVNGVAAKLGPDCPAFDTKNGWFSGKSFREIKELIKTAYGLYEPLTKNFDNAIPLLSGGILVIQGLEGLDHLHIVDIPLLRERLNDVIADAHLDNLDVAPHDLGSFGELSVADALGEAFVIYGVLRALYNLYKTGETRDASASLKSELEEAKRNLSAIKAVKVRAIELNEGLDATSYETFKWAWATQQILAERRSGHRAQAEKKIFDSFGQAACRFWTYLNIPLLEKEGSVHEVALPA
ncbi:MAG: hypothetical protein GC184_13665 [Rhizobiales bacterium]|nr:hypothetical protein [Hyphomicrobiales bacterium]